MSHPIAIEFNDSGIVVCDSRQRLLNSPGYAITLSTQQWLGKDARDRAFLHPNECNHRFWAHIARAKSGTVDHTNTKLALQHLESIWNKVSTDVDAVILTVPATFTKSGLGILLGICRQLLIPVRAMIHHAVLSPRQADHDGTTVHVDMQLHHTAITQLDEINKEFVVARSEVLDQIGLHSLYVQVAEFIAQVFISNTRLDPLHSAELEQQLFNNLPTWLQAMQMQEVVRCQLEYQNSSFEVAIEAEEIKTTLKPQLNKIAGALISMNVAQPIIACTSELLNQQLGFDQFIYSQGIMVRSLATGHHAQQSLYHAEQILSTDAQVYLNKQLPYSVMTDALPSANNIGTDATDTPTHILYRNRAYSLLDNLYVSKSSQTKLRIHYDPEESPASFLSIQNLSGVLTIKASGHKEITVNDQIVESYTQPVVGDSIRIAANPDELVFVKVES